MRAQRLSSRRRLSISVGFGIAIVLVISPWNSVARPQADSQDPAVERGHKQFEQACGFCHGPDGTGARGPDPAEALHSAHVPRSYPVEKLLTGNADAGKAYFNGAGGCKNCHSPTRDFAGIAQKYSPIDLQARMLYPAGRHTTAVVTLPTGEQVKGPLLHSDDFEIALRDASGWYRSFARDRVKVEIEDPLAAHRELLDKFTQADVHNLFAYLQSLKQEKQ